MARGFSKAVFLAVMMNLLMLGVSASPTTDSLNPLGDFEKMDAALEKHIASDDSNSMVEVIFQLNSPITEDDLTAFSRVNADVIGDAPLIDGGLISATESSIREISNWDRIEYLELNRELEFFYLPPEWGGEPAGDTGVMMHETNHVISATDSWQRAIIMPDGNVEFETDLSFTEWDGDGTAIVDLDTGVDAGHPDYDYLEPWTGEKTIYSAKYSGTNWVETRNSDTSSGHGTHVGGTIAGNGDASAGRRAGVAKGAQLVALGTGDGASIFAAEQGLEWTFEHSIPHQNEHHIRVVSNSWGTDGDYDPQGSVAQLTDRLTFENGVAVIFAASNSGGSGGGGECSGDLRTNVYANTPSAISVAALTHDGTAVTSFSSRGCMNQQHTWPDVGAPGRDIWATAPRGTAIDASTRTQGDMYYMAISGTSMATPHVGGIAGLLLNAAPSLTVADYHRDDHDEGDSQVGGEGTAAYGQFEDWDTANFSRVHEVELILELTAQYEGMANSCEEGNADDSCNDIPENCYVSATGKCHDWRVGHGLTNVDHAVALARTLQLMRDPDLNGFVDNPEYNVWDAYEIYQNMMDVQDISVPTDRIRHEWKGDWNHFNNGATGAVYYTEDAHYVWVPNGTTRMEVLFSATEYDLDIGQVGALQLSIDLADDGNNDAQGQGTRTADTWYYDLDIDESAWGSWTKFDVQGQAVTFFRFADDPEFFESSIPYTVDVTMTLDLSEQRIIEFEQKPEYYSDLDPTSPSEEYDDDMDGMLVFRRTVYDQATVSSMITPKMTDDDNDVSGLFSFVGGSPVVSIFVLVLIISVSLGVGYLISSSRVDKPIKLATDDETFEAELVD